MHNNFVWGALYNIGRVTAHSGRDGAIGDKVM